MRLPISPPLQRHRQKGRIDWQQQQEQQPQHQQQEWHEQREQQERQQERQRTGRERYSEPLSKSGDRFSPVIGGTSSGG